MSSPPLPELTLRGVLLGAVITVVFTASNVYLGLKVGLTFASSIPAAVISMAVLRWCRDANILENNMVQTQASAAGTLSSIIFILPGLLMIGHWSGFPFWQTALICAIGGILGVIYTIPLRRVMVVHSSLPYPEGVAAAEILRVASPAAPGEDEGKAAAIDDGRPAPGLRELLLGSGAGALFSLFSGGFKFFSDGITLWLTAGRAAFQLSTGFSLALVGAGYLMGIGAGIAVLLGLLISWGVAVPLLTLATPQAAGQSLSQLAQALWSSQVRFLGAGVIAIASLWTLAVLFKPMVTGVWTSLRERGKRSGEAGRRDRDLPPRGLLLLAAGLLVALLALLHYFLRSAAPDLNSGVLWGMVLGCALFAYLFGFLVAAACGYMAGLVGSSSSPISGIGIVAVILVALMILGLERLLGGLDGSGGRLAIALTLFTTSVVIATAAISNDNLQDLKTGFLVGATPARQQLALIIGCVVGALVIPPVLDLLYQAYGFAGAMPRAGMDESQALGAPQATLLTAIANGIFQHALNWQMMVIGVAIGAGLILVDIGLRRTRRASLPVLAVGLGIYLPPAINVPLIIGALISWGVARRLARRAGETRQPLERYAELPQRRAVLLAAGLIVGESLFGIVLAALIGASGSDAPLALVGAGFANLAQWLGLVVFAALCVALYRYVLYRPVN